MFLSPRVGRSVATIEQERTISQQENVFEKFQLGESCECDGSVFGYALVPNSISPSKVERGNLFNQHDNL
jgi:hypothetical protein